MIEKNIKQANKMCYNTLFFSFIFLIFIILTTNTLAISYELENNTVMTSIRGTDPTTMGSGFKTNNWNNVTTNVFLINASIPTGNDATKIWLLSASKVTLVNTTISNLYGYFNYLIQPNTQYYIMFDKAGTPQTVYQNTAGVLPKTNPYINFTSSNYYSDASGSITAQTFGITGIWIQIGNETSVFQSPSYNVTLSSNPSDINTSLIGYVNYTLNILNVSGNNITNSSSAMLYYNMSTVLNGGCAKFENNICTDSATKNKTMIKVNNTYFTSQIRELDIFPGYYPFYQEYIDGSNITYNYVTYNNNNIKFKVLNFTTFTNPFISFEYDGDNVSGSSTFQIYYCNQTYNTGNPSSNINCELVQNIIPSGLINYHKHGTHKHYVLPINIQTVAKTQNSSFIILNTQSIANGWNFEYLLNTSYNNKSFCIGNFNSWNCNIPNIFDMHIHQFYTKNSTYNGDSFNTWSIFNDGSNYTNTSNKIVDYLEATNQHPSTPSVYDPTPSQKTTISYNTSTSLTFRWNQVVDYENDILTYSLYLTNGIINYYIFANITNSSFTNNSYNATLDRSMINSGLYYSRLYVCDNNTNCVTGSGTTILCNNNYINYTAACVSGAALQTVVDANGCDQALDFPILYNNTYVNCTVPPTQIQYSFSEQQLIIISILGFIILTVLCGIFISGLFFYLTALLFGLLLSISIGYAHSPIILIAECVLLLMFIVTAIFYKKQ